MTEETTSTVEPAAPEAPAAAVETPAAEAPKPAPPATKPEAAAPAVDPARVEALEAEVEKWKSLSRKHERRQLEALGFDADTADQLLKERRDNPKAVAEKVAGYDDLAARIAGIEADRDAARRDAVIARYSIPDEYTDLLEGLSGEALEAKAAKVGALVATKSAPAAPNTDGAGRAGAPVSGPKPIATREEYAALSADERRAARKDGRLDQLLGVTK